MNFKGKFAATLVVALAVLGGAFAVAPDIANAHTPGYGGDCQTGIHASGTNYSASATNHATVHFDGVAVYDQGFSTSFSFVKANPDKTVAHTYQVDITASDGSGVVHTGVLSIPACATPPTTVPPTTVPPTTTVPTPPTTDPKPSLDTGIAVVRPAAAIAAAPAFTG